MLGPLVVIAFTWFMLSRHSWRWGPEIWGWAGAYPAYILLSDHERTVADALRPAGLALRADHRPGARPALVAARWRWWLLGLIAVAGMVQQAWYTQHVILITHLDGVVYTLAGSGGGAGQVEPGDAEVGQQQHAAAAGTARQPRGGRPRRR